MSRRCQHNHHRPRVARLTHPTAWGAACACGWHTFGPKWRPVFIAALAHSQELTS